MVKIRFNIEVEVGSDDIDGLYYRVAEVVRAVDFSDPDPDIISVTVADYVIPTD